ncbi:MAG TPA: ATP-binding protein, partial [Planctomycetota bacterium]|nr:ATP-binding protein [Planctomycetota bacterium]
MNGPAHPHVLVVDDHAPSRYSTRRALTAAGFMVSEAATGGEALALCTEDPPDVVLLDVNLPDMDGFEVCRKLRGSERTAQLPVIHLSATYLENHHRVQGLDAGADGYLTHPVEPVVLVATLRAVLRARSAERAAQRREAEFGAIFERAPNGICLLDPSLAYRDVNPALCQMLGHSRDELLGRCFLDHVTPAERQRATGLAEIVARDRQWRGQLAFRTARNEVVHLLWAVSEHAIPDMLLGIVTDITERRRIEHDRERLLISERAARADAERANRLKDEFLATLSHELRSPLNAIIGWVHVLQSGRMDAGERARGLDVIERNARIQAQLISDLLDVSRIISGKLTLDVERVVPGEMIQAALEGVRPAAQSKGIALDVRVDPAAPVLWGDSARLQQVVWNLVHNAIKFTPKGGRVEVMLHAAGDGVEIVVRDEGIGISPEFLPQLFQRFRQEDATATRTRGGLGLGLAIVKQVVEMHGGRVNASSAGVNQGATFLVFLPVGQPAQARPLTAHP